MSASPDCIWVRNWFTSFQNTTLPLSRNAITLAITGVMSEPLPPSTSLKFQITAVGRGVHRTKPRGKRKMAYALTRRAFIHAVATAAGAGSMSNPPAWAADGVGELYRAA